MLQLSWKILVDFFNTIFPGKGGGMRVVVLMTSLLTYMIEVSTEWQNTREVHLLQIYFNTLRIFIVRFLKRNFI